MTANEALAFIEERGIVLVSARGPVACLTEAIVGEAIGGSWWGHPRSHEIFRVLQAVTSSVDVLVCRLVGGKRTLVHRRLWPALARLAGQFPPEHLVRVREEHTRSGRHVNEETPFPAWVPADVTAAAKKLDEEAARASLRSAGWTPDSAARTTRRRR